MKVCDSFYPFYPSELFSEYFNKFFNEKYIEEIQEIEFRCKSVDDIKQLKDKYGALLDKKCDQTLLHEVESAKEILVLAKENCILGHNVADEIQDSSADFISQLMGTLSLVLGGGIMFLSELNIGAKTALLLVMYVLEFVLYKLYIFKTKNKEAVSEMDRLYRKAITCMSVFESAVNDRINN